MIFIRNKASKTLSSRACYSSRSKDSDYCFNLVKQRDYEGFCAGLLFPYSQRQAFYALRAFNVEVATIREQTPRSAQQTGRLRFQFWRDILAKIAEKKDISEGKMLNSVSSSNLNHPVADELCKAVIRYGLTVRWLERCLEARYSDLMGSGRIDTIADVEEYAELSHSSILYLFLETMEIESKSIEHIEGTRKGYSDLQFAASHIGVAAGIASLLRGHAHHISNGQCYIPKDVTLKFNMDDRLITRKYRDEAERKLLQDSVHEVASQAYAHLNAGIKLFNESSNKIERRKVSALLPAVSAKHFLDELQRVDFDPFLLPEETTPLALHLKMLKASVLRKLG